MVTNIIPDKQVFYDKRSYNLLEGFSFQGSTAEVDLMAICCFVATGFFLEDDTYSKNVKVVPPSSLVKTSGSKILSMEPNWKWHYSPREEITFDQAVGEFSDLFERIVQEQTKNQNVILPLSGGLDSRTQAVALKDHSSVYAYSYQFKNGIRENWYGKKISKACNFKFKEFQIESSYLWRVIEDLADINLCFTDFTHPRQMAVVRELCAMGNVFSLGHWGDVLFDNMGIPGINNENDLRDFLIKKIVKKGGLELAESLWASWQLEGNFKEYFTERVSSLLDKIEIKNINAKVRAFKSMYWAPRWTSVNLEIFAQAHPIKLPYYDNRMCQFICTIPEGYLANREIQIEYIKNKAPELAKIPWQNVHPFNLYNAKKYNSIWGVPYKIKNKAKNVLIKNLLKKKVIQRNWELQFLNDRNQIWVHHYLLDNKEMHDFLPLQIVENFYRKFYTQDNVQYAHAIGMLLTLSLFSKKYL